MDVRKLLRSCAVVALAAIPATTAVGTPAPEQPGFELREGRPRHLLLGEAEGTPRVELALWFDAEGLHFAADVHDATCRDGFRSWRHGNGFTVNVVLPEADDTVDGGRFDAFGFGLENGRPVAVAVNRDGRYLLAPERDVSLEIHCDPPSGAIHYRVAIPWRRLARFRPLLDQRLGLNVVYISQRDDGSRTILQLVHDPGYDTESTPRRRFVPVTLLPGADTPRSLTGALEHRVVRSHRLEGTLAMHLLEPLDGEVSLEVHDAEGRPVVFQHRTVSLPAGFHRLPVELPLPRSLSGMGTLVAGLEGELEWRETFLVVFEGELERLPRTLAARETDAADPWAAAEAAGLLLRWRELEVSLARLGPRDDPSEVAAELADLATRAHMAGRPGTPPPTGLLRLGFRSSLDGSLQPLTLYLPEGFDPAGPASVIVALHGSGVDEMGTVAAAGRAWARGGTLVVGPRGRGLSDWWIGESEQDVLDAVAAVCALVPVERVALYGFSMGGYGAARLLIRHPEQFAAAVVVAGTPANLRTRSESDDLRRVPLGASRPVLWIHGSEDRSLPLGDAEALVERLRQAGWPVEFVRVDGGGHGDFPIAPHVGPWLEKLLAAGDTPTP